MKEVLKMDLQKFAIVPGLLSQGTTLSYKDGATAKTIAAVKSIPSIGSDPEKVDVTHLGSQKKAYITGIQDSDNLEFAIVYQGDNFKDVDTLVKLNKIVEWTVTYKDGMKIVFSGQASYKFDGAEVNGALGFNLVIVVSDGPTFTPAPAV